MIMTGIVGGTGYTGVELLRLLANHPHVELAMITSRSHAGTRVADLFSNLRGFVELSFTEPDPARLRECDVVFFATPNGTAMGMVPALLKDGVRIIDLGADFRLKDVAVWEEWYKIPHECPELLAEVAYGLPELDRAAIRSARLVANPGCYPTAVLLGFMPLLEQSLLSSSPLIADAKSGVSGAGRQANVTTLFSEASDSLKAYAVAGHRHLPEIRQGLEKVAKEPVELVFVPHVTPMIRGIHASLYATLRKPMEHDLQLLYEQHYSVEPFVDVLPLGSHPDTRSVRGSNICRIAVHQPQGGTTVVVLSVIDNLVKGAAGQAVQNMNLMFGLEETEGLQSIALLP